MELIKIMLKNRYNLAADNKYGMLVGDNGLIKVQVEPPRTNCLPTDEHSKWLLRMAPSESFDRWSVSAAITERFDAPEQIVSYLSNAADVYKMLLKKLSEDYKELEDKYLDSQYGEWDK